MEIFTQYSEVAATFIVRVFLGLLFFFQGYDAIFRVKVQNIVEVYKNSIPNNPIPKFLIVSGAWFTAMTELICGLLLVLGLYQSLSLYLLGLNMLIACIGFSISSPMWDMKHVFPRLTLLIFLLLSPVQWNIWSLDHLILTLK